MNFWFLKRIVQKIFKKSLDSNNNKLSSVCKSLSLIFFCLGSFHQVLAETKVTKEAKKMGLSLPKKKIIICAENREVAPYWLGYGQSFPKKRPGLAVEQFAELGKKLPNISFEFRRMPWKRCLILLKRGECNAIVATYKKGREKIGVFPRTKEGKINGDYTFGEPFGMALLRRKEDNIRFEKGTFLSESSLTLGLILGHGTEDYFARKNSKYKTISVSSIEGLMDMLILKRVDVVALAELPALMTIYGNLKYKDKIFMLGRIQDKKGVSGGFLLFSKDFYQENKKLVGDIWKLMPEINERTKNKIWKRYLNAQMMDKAHLEP